MHKPSRVKIARAAAMLMHKQPTRRRAITRDIASYLVARGRTREAGLLARDIAEAATALTGDLIAEVHTAFKLGPSAKHNIENLLKIATGAKAVQLAEHHNPQIIGGVLVRTNQFELDATIKSQLARLAEGEL